MTSCPQCREQILSFACDGDRLYGILHRAAGSPRLGIVVIGGVVHRTGYNRMFVRLARAWASAGIAVLRFDRRGMGDSEGVQTQIHHAAPDISSAITALQEACPTIQKVVLWGFCAGASAALLYAPRDQRVGGLVLVDPWIAQRRSEAEARIFFVLSRLLQTGFWSRFLKSEVRLGKSFRELLGDFRIMFRLKPSNGANRGPATASGEGAISKELLFPRMQECAFQFGRPMLAIIARHGFVGLSGLSFLIATHSSAAWRKLRSMGRLQEYIIGGADHEFKGDGAIQELANVTASWVHALPSLSTR